VVIDDELRNAQRSHRLGERTQAGDVADVHHDERIDPPERRRSLGRPIADIVAEQEAEHRRPRRRIHDADRHPALREKTREGSLRSAAVAIGVHVRRQRNRAPGWELGGDPMDGIAPMRGYREQVVRRRGHAACSVSKRVLPGRREAFSGRHGGMNHAMKVEPRVRRRTHGAGHTE
jgi:hypothetical protein